MRMSDWISDVCSSDLSGAPPWRQMLERRIREPYVLINTSFPSVNPRFSAGAGAEIEAMISAGFSKDFAEEYIAAARSAISGIIDQIGRASCRERVGQYV